MILANLVTETMTNMINEMPCGCQTLTTTAVTIWHQVSRRACTEVSAALEVSCRPAQRSQKLQNLTLQIVNFVASWMHLHNSRCFREDLRMLLQSLRAYCKAPGGPGRIWKYLEALVRTTGVSERFVCGFWTNLYSADVVMVMMIVMVMIMVMVLVLVMVIMVPVPLRQVGWLHQCEHWSFPRLCAFH